MLELVDIFGPAPVTSTHTSADPWDIPGGSNPQSAEVWNHDTAFSPPPLSLSSSWEQNSKELCTAVFFLFSFPSPSFHSRFGQLGQMLVHCFCVVLLWAEVFQYTSSYEAVSAAPLRCHIARCSSPLAGSLTSCHMLPGAFHPKWCTTLGIMSARPAPPLTAVGQSGKEMRTHGPPPHLIGLLVLEAGPGWPECFPEWCAISEEGPWWHMATGKWPSRRGGEEHCAARHLWRLY